MKSMEELLALRDKKRAELTARDDDTEITRVVVGMATCGIAAGARPVMEAIVEEVGTRKVQNIHVTQTGCIGMCQYEPIVEVLEPNKEKVTYVKVTAEIAKRIVLDHLVNGQPVVEYTVGTVDK